MLHGRLDILTGFFLRRTETACPLADIEIGRSFAATDAIGPLGLIASFLRGLFRLGSD
jgi:hypothetical protein